MEYKLLQEMENLLKEEEEKKKEGTTKVAKTLAQKVYHRDYVKTKKKKYRVDQD